MSNLYELTNAVVWREGSLLCPQHLQQQERYLSSRTRQVFRLSRPYAWGVLELEVDDNQLNRAEFHVKKLRAVLPDGLQIALGENDPLPASRSFDDEIQKVSTSLTVYLGVPVEKPGMPSYDVAPEEIHETERKTRYCVRSEEIFDQTQDHERNEVQTASARSRLLFGKENRDDYVSMPIARVIRTPDGFALDESFIAPALTLDACGRIASRVAGLVDTAKTRIKLLKEHRSRRSQQGLELSARDTGIYMWLFALGARAGELKALLQTPSISPMELFRELCGTEGQLSALTPGSEESEDFQYDHDDIYQSLVPLIDRIHTLIEFPFRKSFVSVELSRRHDGMWLGNLSDDFIAARGDLVLAVKSAHEPTELARRMPALAKLASFTQVADLVHSALRGTPLNDLRHPPETIPSAPKTVFFAIDATDNYWQRIVSEKNVALYIGAPFNNEDMEIQLMVGLRDARESIVPS